MSFSFQLLLGVAMSQLQFLPSLVSITNYLPTLKRVSSPTHFPSGFLLFILYFSTLLADLHGQGCNPSRLSKQPRYAAVPEVWIQD